MARSLAWASAAATGRIPSAPRWTRALGSLLAPGPKLERRAVAWLAPGAESVEPLVDKAAAPIPAFVSVVVSVGATSVSQLEVDSRAGAASSMGTGRGAIEAAIRSATMAED